MLKIRDLSNEFEAGRGAIVNYERETSYELDEYRDAIPDRDRAETSINNFLPRYSGAMIFEPGISSDGSSRLNRGRV